MKKNVINCVYKAMTVLLTFVLCVFTHALFAQNGNATSGAVPAPRVLSTLVGELNPYVGIPAIIPFVWRKS